MRPLKSAALWNQVLDELMKAIAQMAPGQNRLPAEVELAKKLRVSRATLREALQILAADGYLSRRHGKGSFAHPSAKKLRHRIDLTGDFAHLISQDGMTGTYQVMRAGYTPGHPAMPGEIAGCDKRFFEQFWLYSLGKKPMIYCKIYVPEKLLALPPRPPEGQQILIDWIAKYCRRDVAYYAVHMGCRADSDACWTFGLPEGTVAQNWREMVYDIDDYPIGFCDIFFHPENLDLSMVLKV